MTQKMTVIRFYLTRLRARWRRWRSRKLPLALNMAEGPKRKREYRLYSMDRYAVNLTNSGRADRYAWPWVFTVYAASVKQAYFLANEHIWASGPGQVGMRRIELDRWHWDWDRDDERGTSAEARGWIQHAPYLRRDGLA